MADVDPNVYLALCDAYWGGLHYPVPGQEGYRVRVSNELNWEYVPQGEDDHYLFTDDQERIVWRAVRALNETTDESGTFTLDTPIPSGVTNVSVEVYGNGASGFYFSRAVHTVRSRAGALSIEDTDDQMGGSSLTGAHAVSVTGSVFRVTITTDSGDGEITWKVVVRATALLI